MIDMSKEIIYRDGINLTEGTRELTERFLANVGHVCDLGRNFGLTLDKFEIDAELVYFEWRGRKEDVLKFYTYYSENMLSESLYQRKATQAIILNK